MKPTWTNLASALNVSRVTLTLWRKRPDAPKSADAEEWRRYMRANGLGLAGNRTQTNPRDEMKERIRWCEAHLYGIERRAAKISQESGAQVLKIRLSMLPKWEALYGIIGKL